MDIKTLAAELQRLESAAAEIKDKDFVSYPAPFYLDSFRRGNKTYYRKRLRLHPGKSEYISLQCHAELAAKLERGRELHRLQKRISQMQQRLSATEQSISRLGGRVPKNSAIKSANGVKQTDCWRTPNTEDFPILDLVQRVFGGVIGLDPTADDLKRVPAVHHFTATDNCLEQSWKGLGTVFMNPPFSKPLPFVRKLAEEYQAGHIPEAIALLKAGAMSNQGTGAIIKNTAVAACHWNRRRISYLNEEGLCVAGADFDSILVYFGGHPDRFEQIFDAYGTVTSIKKSA